MRLREAIDCSDLLYIDAARGGRLMIKSLVL